MSVVQTQNKMLLPLTDAQSGIWFAQHRVPNNPVYTTGEYLVISGDFNEPCFVEAMTVAINEADTLHAQFIMLRNEPHLYIEHQAWQVQKVNMSKQDAPHQAALDWMNKALAKSIDLEKGPLFSTAILTLSEQERIWFLSAHHIVIDGYSMSLLMSRVAHIYNRLLAGQPFESITYASQQAMLEEDQKYKASQQYQSDRDFYLHHYAQMPESVSLAGKPSAMAEHFFRVKGELDVQSTAQLHCAAQHSETTWPCVLLAAIATYIHRMTNAKEVVLGVPLMGRLGSVAIQTPAMRVNILPVRVQFEPNMETSDLIQQVSHEFSLVRQHQHYRYEHLHRELNLVKDKRNLFGPLVNIMPFTHQPKLGESTTQLRNLSAGPVEDLSVYCYQSGDTLHLDMDANPELYSESEVQQHHRRLKHFMGHFFTSAQSTLPSRIADIDLFLPGEYDKITQTWNETFHDIPDTTLSALMARQRIVTPNATALIFDDTKLSYEQLGRKVYSLTQWLIGQGIDLGDRIAVCVPRSEELIVVQQAILAAGAVYVPIDPDYPSARIRFMLSSSAPRRVFTTSALISKLPSESELTLVDDELLPWIYQNVEPLPPQVTPLPKSPAYIIYTSGSTGQPKGVVISHDAIVNRLLWMQAQYPIDAHDRVLQKTPSGFDVSVWEFFWPMMVGACLVVAKPAGHKDPIYLQEVIEKHQITTLHFVPSMLQLFVQYVKNQQGNAQRSGGHQIHHQHCASLRQVFCSGEALPSELVQEYSTCFDAPLENLYGPTEAAIDVTYWHCQANSAEQSVPIGRPVWNTQIYILDDELKPVPPGVVGHLHIAGRQLALGYHGQPQLTAERFIDNPFGSSGSRMYMSGDLARWRSDGAIEYCGRSDFQVKIRGLRIELEEIESALNQHPSVAQSVVLAQEYRDNDKRLVAYILPTSKQNTDTQELINSLSSLLPSYMIPSYFVPLETWPLTANGKLDRQALPKPDLSEQVGSQGPTCLVEERLCKLFADLLDLPSVGVTDNFFALGGHSLLAAKLSSQIKEYLGYDLPLATIFASPTVAGIAANLVGNDKEQALNIVLPLRSHQQNPALFCVHPAGGLAWCYASLTATISVNVPLYGIQARNFSNSSAALPRTITEMAQEYVDAIREIQPTGPYHLVGWSIGGMLVHRMAGLIQQQGQEVGLVAMMDAYPAEQWQQMHVQGDEQAMEALIRMAGIEYDPIAHADLNRSEVIDVLQNAGSSMANFSADILSTVVDVVINNRELAREEVDYQYCGDVLFFNAQKLPQEKVLNFTGWDKYNHGDFKVIDIACLHRDMVRPDILQQIGEHIQSELAKF
ncbi:non-ribosomal peptide synthetase [Vibrio sagamiensis]|uniref:Carrier domain-containing protein n=1 Tax=Vibrio sagamiensis NBRC 104589 TaxID=1219064 RepID=A0A511QBW5_9VIBR|nr:non-ribosomal peptide synthetase [Vibrio sagamiensis]PNQ71782.1 non-ribosomal peptide synthetase [Vibrio agarivorans]GEM74789.1 hypothetical protein VSA01S_09010 [Vibrio sagamiensis NBRC 104589]